MRLAWIAVGLLWGCASPPFDLCGDGFCDVDEECAASCPVDCGAITALPASYQPCDETLAGACDGAGQCREFDTGFRPDHVVSSSFCTHDCACDHECPPDRLGVPGACVSFPRLPPPPPHTISSHVTRCFQRCTDTSDCAVGFRCYDAASVGGSGGAPSVCLPDAGDPPAAAPYYPCTSDLDCSNTATTCQPITAGGATYHVCSILYCFGPTGLGESDCPGAGGMYGACGPGPTNRMCFLPCGTGGRCPEGLACRTDVIGTGWPNGVCAPP